MAEVTFRAGVAFKTQAALGTAETFATGGSLGVADGIVLGDAESGVGETGITFELERDFREKAVVSGSLTRPISDFIGESISNFQFAFPLKGNGGTATPAAGEAKPDPGVDDLLLGAGFAGANGTDPDYVYTPIEAGTPGSTLFTSKVWINGQLWVIRDCIVSELVIDQTPGTVGIATATIAGKVDSFALTAFPTFNYGAQQSLSAPSVAQVGHNWGISAALRGFTTGSITISNETEELADSNAEGGTRERQTGRVITFEGTLLADDGDLDFERAELVKSTFTAGQWQQTWTVGTPAGATDTINAYTLSLTNPELRELAINRVGVAYAVDVTLRAIDDNANGEFSLTFE